MTEAILAIDQGTTGTTVVLIDREMNVLAKGYQDYRQIYPRPGWVEHDPNAIWESVLSAIDQVFKQRDASRIDLRAIGITNQRETTLLWNRQTGRPYYNAIVWQCRRTAEICDNLNKAGHGEEFHRKTGLVLDPYFSGTKLKWLFDNIPVLYGEAGAGRAAFGTVDAYLVWRLTGGRSHVTDVSNASRTLLMNLETLRWDEDLCEILNIPGSILPEIVPSAGMCGETRDVPGLPDGVPVCGLAGDQQAALFGQACFKPGEAKCTYGTGAFLLMNTGAKPIFSRNGLLTTVAWKIAGQTAYALEGSAFIAGSAVQWLRDGLKIIRKAADIEDLASQVEDTGGVIMVPAFVGLGAPYWRPEARGIISGITLGTTEAHLARAVLEGIALQNVEILKAMEADSGYELLHLKVDGGACVNNLLMQIQADFLDRRIIRPVMIETTAMGAAFLAGLGAGIWKDINEIAGSWKRDRVFSPRMTEDVRAAVLDLWRQAAGKA